MTYEELLKLEAGIGIAFIEYELDRHERKRETRTVRGRLLSVIQPEEKLDNNLLSTYYPYNSEQDYPMLSYSSDVRLVLQVGTNKLDIPIYKTISVNQYFYSVGLQEIETQEIVLKQPEIPSQILGFNSYDFGKKFK